MPSAAGTRAERRLSSRTRPFPELPTGCAVRHLDGISDPIFYIAGPATMVQGLRAMLVASGVDEDDIRTEEFTGY
jgi:hypothetical protein